MIIAETILYRKQRGKAQRVRIAIARPERDPLPGGDWRCRVAITGEKVRHVFGIDSFQALDLSFVYVRSVMSQWLKQRQRFFCDRRMQWSFDVRGLILNDLSFYERLGRMMQRKGIHV